MLPKPRFFTQVWNLLTIPNIRRSCVCANLFSYRGEALLGTATQTAIVMTDTWAAHLLATLARDTGLQ